MLKYLLLIQIMNLHTIQPILAIETINKWLALYHLKFSKNTTVIKKIQLA
jgi:hypothetical protein